MPPKSTSDLSAKLFSELISGPVVDVYVGPERRHWSVHHNLLAFHAEYFNGEHLDGGELCSLSQGRMELPGDDPEAFDLFIKWLYQGRIDDVSTLPNDQKWDYAHACQKLYMLCDKIGMRDLQNAAIDQFRQGCFETALVPGPEEMLPIYKDTAPSSPFRKLVSRIAARQLMDPLQERDAATYRSCFEASPDFAIDVINTIRQATGGLELDDPTRGNSCGFHEHQDGEHCRKTVKFAEVHVQQSGKDAGISSV